MPAVESSPPPSRSTISESPSERQRERDPDPAAHRARGRRSAPTARRAARPGTRSAARSRRRAGGSRGSRTTARTRARRSRTPRGTAARAACTRSRAGAITSRTSTNPIAAPSERTSSSRSDEKSEPRITFDTVPLTPRAIAADAAMAYPTRGRRCAAGSTGSGASLTPGSLRAAPRHCSAYTERALGA